jgi:DNA modification methylase
MNRIFCGDARCMDQVTSESVHLVVTSPPYNVGKGYKDHRENRVKRVIQGRLDQKASKDQRVMLESLEKTARMA